MDTGQLISILAVGTAAFGIFVTVIIFAIKKSSSGLKEMFERSIASQQKTFDDHVISETEEQKEVIRVLEKINNSILGLNNDIADFKLKVSDDYVRNGAFRALDTSNQKSHENFWKEIKRIDRHVVAIETNLKLKIVDD